MDHRLDTVKAYLRVGNLKDAVALLGEITKDRRHRFHNEVIVHSARLQQVLQEERLGTVPMGYVSSEKKRILLALLGLVDEMTDEKTVETLGADDSRSGLMVFLSYSSEDRSRILQLYERLKTEDGINPWLDVAELLPGVDWNLEIRSAVRAAHVILICLSRKSVSKEGYVQKEIRQALDLADEKPEGTIFIIPLRLDECEIPERLKQWQWLDLFEGESYDRLMNSLRKRATDLTRRNIDAA